MTTEFEKDLHDLEESINNPLDLWWEDKRKAFIAKYDPAKQLQSNVTRIAGAMDAQTVEEGLSFLWGRSPHEKPIKTTQFDTLTNPTHIVHPLHEMFSFEIKDYVETIHKTPTWFYKNTVIAEYNEDEQEMYLYNPLNGYEMSDFKISKLVLDLPKK